MNTSHVCLVKNWTTFRKMQMSAGEIDKHLMEVVKGVIKDIIRQHGSWLAENENNEKNLEKWYEFALTPKNLIDFKRQGVKLFDFGIEGICLDEIVAEGDFQAYVYSPDRNAKKHEGIFFVLEDLLKRIVPKDFTLSIDQPKIGYFYTKKLSPLDADKLCDAKFLSEHIRDPLNSIIDWYKQHEKEIIAIEPKRFKRV